MLSRHWILLVIASLGWGAGGVLTRAAFLEGMDAVEFAFYRPVFAALVLAGYVAASGAGMPRAAREWRVGLVLGSTNLAAPFLLLTLAVVYASAGFVGLLVANVSIATAIWAHLLGDDSLTRAKSTGLAISFAGVIVLLASGDSGIGEDGNPALAIVLTMVGLASIGFGINYAKRALAGMTPASVALPQFVVGSLLLGLLVPFTDGLPRDIAAMGWLLVAAAGVFSTAVPFILFYETMKHVTALQASLSGYIIPVFAVALGAIWLGEEITRWMLVGGALILVGVILTDRASSIPARVATD